MGILVTGLVGLILAFRIYDLFWGATARSMRAPGRNKECRLNAFQDWGKLGGPKLG